MSRDRILDRVNSPLDLKMLSLEEMNRLAAEIRQLMLDVVSKNGGHLAPNLGVVELTIALHRVFDSPRDKFVFDVGHQAYIHKIITGRKDRFPTLRQYKGLSGFPKRQESEHDVFGVGHSSTSISAADGIAAARDLLGDDYHVVAIIGDGAMTGGMSFEALNHVGDTKRRLIIILNDNEMSISKNVGAMSQYLYQLRTGETYNRLKHNLENWLSGLEHGDDVLEAIDRVKTGVKYLVNPESMFEHLGIKYFGPVDGHNIEALIPMLTAAKKEDGPVLLHVITKKGKGYAPAEESPNKFHGTGPFDIATGKKITKPGAPPSYTDVFGKTLVELAEKDKRIVAITAAMPDGTGVTGFAQRFPDRFFDVGIAEQHAVTFAAGLATQGIKAVAAIYSTFMQRAYDQVLHDVCMQKLPVKLCMDRAGLVGDDGYTHHGVFDYAYLLPMPHMVIMAPKDENELRHMLATAMEYDDGPISLRYPRGSGLGVDCSEALHTLPIGRAERIRTGTDVSLWAIGSMVSEAEKTAELLQEKGVYAGVVNMRFAKPLDTEMLFQDARDTHCIVTMEEGVVIGGVGEAVVQALNNHGLLDKTLVLNFGIPDEFISQGDRKLLLRDIGLTPELMADRILDWMKKA
ncbi:MAG: 1-deoxy-D-xylulose-5-phosphate synthase [Succiniclasticum sp.]|uniref:1-deoxy-D-xylulose-5-phosphate synthase n=1 Tax=Succiniclasticum sp. TaxID=2775030 RepID=UPI002A90F317|nr:1-deoxy-D-xylulose-5-phosphate synthase [Succiniclasticum sp.]MDY6290199.1 1-deoxy-D-xylulose-5-phosphate synthase [Succiniclasticum sp.]